MTNAMTVYDQFDQLQRAAIALKDSGYFSDVKSKAQAIVKVMAGAELGLPPFASMTGIHIIQGKPVLGANVLATLVKNDPRYDYKIKTATDQKCELTWYENGQEVGPSAFTIAEAKAANLNGKDNWKRYPSDMLFARAISRGARRYAPGIFGGSPVYTPDEMGADVDEEGNVIVDSVAVDVTKPTPETVVTTNKPPDKPTSNGKRPYTPELIKEKLPEFADNYADFEPTPKQRSLLHHGLELCFAGNKEAEDQLHTVLFYLTGLASIKDVSGPELKALLENWLNIEQDPDTQEYSIDPMAAQEAQAIFTKALAGEGQKELL